MDCISVQVLGKALKELPRDKIFVTSKCGRYDEAEFDFSAARVKRSVRESLQRLQLDHLDLLHCHDIEFVKLDQARASILCTSLIGRGSLTFPNAAKSLMIG